MEISQLCGGGSSTTSSGQPGVDYFPGTVWRTVFYSLHITCEMILLTNGIHFGLGMMFQSAKEKIRHLRIHQHQGNLKIRVICRIIGTFCENAQNFSSYAMKAMHVWHTDSGDDHFQVSKLLAPLQPILCQAISRASAQHGTSLFLWCLTRILKKVAWK